MGRNGKSDIFMPKKPRQYQPQKNVKSRSRTDAYDWIWGTHSAMAALQNSRRKIHRILITRNNAGQILDERLHAVMQELPPNRISEVLPDSAVHQGMAVAASPLQQPTLSEILAQGTGPFLMLDQVTDPRNIGAIFRSAAAFGAKAIIAQDRHFPPLTGVLAKSAVGAVEMVPLVSVTNLSRALEDCAKAGFVSIGLAGDTDLAISDIDDNRPKVIVLGAEGKGIRPNVRKHCDLTARIPMDQAMESLNVSVAASIALYELTRQSG